MNGTPRVFSESVTMAGITKFCPINNWDIFVDKNQHNLDNLCNFMAKILTFFGQYQRKRLLCNV